MVVTKEKHMSGGKRDWEHFGTITEYDIWFDGEIYQISKGGQPSGEGGYRRLESLLALKGLNRRDLVVSDTFSSVPSFR